MRHGGFNHSERHLITGISLVMGLRMLGVSMIIPIFSIFATELPGSTPSLAGLAVGIFGIVQIILQVPFGRLSDHWGRKQVTLLGLGIYFAGTVLSGMAEHIRHLIGARFLAGAGAINGVTMAWLTDGIHIDRRNSALSYVGMSMGLAVIFGFSLSPVIAAKIGIPLLFYMCAALILITMIYTHVCMTNTECAGADPLEIRKEGLLAVFKNPDLVRLNLIGFIGNFNVNSVFFVVPLVFKQRLGMGEMWKIFIPVSLLGTILMFYFGRQADRRGTVAIALVGLALELAGFAAPILSDSLGSYIVSFALFYSGHCVLAPVLPAAVSRYPHSQLKGTVMSVFNSFQFLGSGVGGMLCGIMLEFNHRYVFIALGVLILAGAGSLMGFRDYKRG